MTARRLMDWHVEIGPPGTDVAGLTLLTLLDDEGRYVTVALTDELRDELTAKLSAALVRHGEIRSTLPVTHVER